ncbi:hypothetical protein AALP_AA7G051900 [Arabis alpina]|uniref:Hydrophobic seed protein domain-containing protein n=1 Tax=Arabis alpina TaxID=50452 RepID=A0A087GG08_ARAAL|nr:hypothetical protein AALP_AA7G051900 [Arabis alpina]
MASKNMTTIMALYLTFNLVLLGFTSAQPTTCPLTQRDIGVCVNVLNLVRIGINPPAQGVQACCNLLGGVTGPAAAACACDILTVRILGLNISLRLRQLLNLCPGLGLPTDLLCN